jgi:hypothetical protein
LKNRKKVISVAERRRRQSQSEDARGVCWLTAGPGKPTFKATPIDKGAFRIFPLPMMTSKLKLKDLLGATAYDKLLKLTNGTVVFGIPVPDLSPDDLKVAWAVTMNNAETARRHAEKAFNMGRYEATVREGGSLAKHPHDPLTCQD